MELFQPDALGYRIATLGVGTTATFAVWRKGKAEEIEITLDHAPEGSAAALVAIDGASPFAGAKVAELSPRLAQKLRLPETTKGVAIVEIDRRSPAGQFGLAPGDIVRAVNGTDIDTVEALVTAAAEDTRWWRFSIERDGQTINQMLRY